MQVKTLSLVQWFLFFCYGLRQDIGHCSTNVNSVDANEMPFTCIYND